MSKTTKIVIAVAAIALLGGAGWYFFFYKKNGYQFAYDWLKANANPPDASAPMTYYNACIAAAQQSGASLTDEQFFAAWYQWLTDNGIALPASITDRPGADSYAAPITGNTDRTGIDSFTPMPTSNTDRSGINTQKVAGVTIG